jgi:F-type H+-transporting ATPase subunit b
MAFFHDPANWVLVSFLLFIALLVYLKVPALLAKSLDDRAAKIASELDNAKKLHDEATALLAESKAKLAGAEKEAAAIVAAAKADAEAYATDARKKFQDSMSRRMAQAKAKIARAEAAAEQEVRGIASDLAIKAAQSLLAANAKGKTSESLIAESIAAVKTRLN